MNILILAKAFVCERFETALKSQHQVESFKHFSSLLEAFKKSQKSIIILQSHDNIKHEIRELHALLATVKIFVINPNPQFSEGMSLLKDGIKAYANAYIADVNIPNIIGHIANGNIWLYPEFMQEMIKATMPKTERLANTKIKQLSKREQETATLVADGLSNKAIALEMDVTERTVKSHLSSIFIKLEVKDRISLALLLNR